MTISEVFTNIANAIRAKTGTSTTYTPDEMPQAISEITTGEDTSDATAYAADIANGKTAYARGSKITGTNTKDSDTSDATALNTDILSGKTAYVQGSKVTGTMTNRGAISTSISPGGSYTIPAGYHNGSGTVSASSPNLQTKTQTVTPSANWSSATTGSVTITPDSGYDGMSQVNVSVPMLRDNTLFVASTVDAPSTVYNGDTSQSNSEKMLRIAPTKDGMSYTNSYVYLAKNSYLGNATAADVVSGKTFSSAAGIQVTGTGSSGGTDTSDATLDSGSRMLSGYTAYANGTKYTGSITSRSANSETISSSRTYYAGYYPSSWTVTPSGGGGSAAITTVWSNSSPSSSFSGQTIQLSQSLSEADGIIIKCYQDNLSLSAIDFYMMDIVTNLEYVFGTYAFEFANSSSIRYSSREFTVKSGYTTIYISDNYIRETGEIDNRYLIPYRIDKITNSNI